MAETQLWCCAYRIKLMRHWCQQLTDRQTTYHQSSVHLVKLVAVAFEDWQSWGDVPKWVVNWYGLDVGQQYICRSATLLQRVELSVAVLHLVRLKFTELANVLGGYRSDPLAFSGWLKLRKCNWCHWWRSNKVGVWKLPPQAFHQR